MTMQSLSSTPRFFGVGAVDDEVNPLATPMQWAATQPYAFMSAIGAVRETVNPLRGPSSMIGMESPMLPTPRSGIGGFTTDAMWEHRPADAPAMLGMQRMGGCECGGDCAGANAGCGCGSIGTARSCTASLSSLPVGTAASAPNQNGGAGTNPAFVYAFSSRIVGASSAAGSTASVSPPPSDEPPGLVLTPGEVDNPTDDNEFGIFRGFVNPCRDAEICSRAAPLSAMASAFYREGGDLRRLVSDMYETLGHRFCHSGECEFSFFFATHCSFGSSRIYWARWDDAEGVHSGYVYEWVCCCQRLSGQHPTPPVGFDPPGYDPNDPIEYPSGGE